MEIRNGRAAVLMEDGSFITTDRKCSVGDVIELKQRKHRKLKPAVYRWALSCAAIVLGVFGWHHYYAVPYAYVSIDVNPSLEFAVNRMERVVEVTAVNKDAETAADALTKAGVKGKTVETAIDLAVDELTEENYLGKDKTAVLVGLSSNSSSSLSHLESQVARSTLGSDSDTYEVYVETADASARDDAMKENVSVGRYVAAGLNSSDKSGSSADSLEKAKNSKVSELVSGASLDDEEDKFQTIVNSTPTPSAETEPESSASADTAQSASTAASSSTAVTPESETQPAATQSPAAQSSASPANADSVPLPEEDEMRDITAQQEENTQTDTEESAD